MKNNNQEAEKAVITLLSWLGEDTNREGLRETPQRFLKALKEYCQGYHQDPKEILSKTFEEVGGYHDIVLLKDISFESLCEHHLAPFVGKAHIAYLPSHRVVGLSKIARLVDVFSRRLQIQERLTAQIADTLFNVLDARGVVVKLEATHHCMMTRGVRKANSTFVTIKKLGVFENNPIQTQDVLNLMA